MPRRKDLESILIIGSGPIVIGQACEFDYSGTQACKALREEGLRVILINSNPATIMTDPGARRRDLRRAAHRRGARQGARAARSPSAILPTLGGQTGLNLAMAARKAGPAREARRRAARRDASTTIEMAEDRELFKQAMARIGLACPRSRLVDVASRRRARCVDEIGFPAILRPSFTLGGSGGGIAYNRAEFDRMVQFGARPVAGALDPRRGERARLEGVRARGRARRARTTRSSCARSRTSIRWACTPATRSPSRRR